MLSAPLAPSPSECDQHPGEEEATCHRTSQGVENFRRNNLRAIRTVLNVGETLSEFVRLAVLAEVARRRDEDEAI